MATEVQLLVGRTRELAVLGELIDRAKHGEGGVIAVVGEPGVGKSTLLTELISRGPAGAVWLTARGVESEATLPFSGLHQLAYPQRRFVDRLPTPQAKAMRGAMGIEYGDPAHPFLVGLGTLGLISEAASDGLAAVLVDDFAWLDTASREAVLFAARRVTREHVAVILATRTDDWGSVGDPNLPVLELSGLDEEAAASLLAGRARAVAHDDVNRRLVQATGGNPLALLEAAADLSPEQLRGDDPLPPHLPVNAGLEQAFVRPIASAHIDLHRLLLLAAADETGRREVLARAASAAGIPTPFIDEALERRILVERADTIEYRHPLIRSTVYGRATVADRRAAHMALAEALETSDPERALWHRLASADGPDESLADRVESMARRAEGRGALDDAVRAWERAASLVTVRSEVARMLLRGAAAAWAAGRLGKARQLLVRARDTGALEDGLRVEAYWVSGGIELAAGDALRSYRHLVEAASASEQTDPERALLILNVAAEAASLSGERSATADLAGIVDRIPQLAGTRPTLLRTALLGFAAEFQGDLATAVAHLREAVDLASAIDEPTGKLVAGRAAIYIGDDRAARDLHQAVVDHAREHASVDLVPIAGPRLALAELLLGRWPSAQATAEETTRIADDTGQVLLAPHGRLWLGLLAAARGDDDESEAHVRAALAPVSGRRVGLLEDGAAWVRGVRALGRQRPREALVHLAPIAHPVVEALAGLDRLEAAADVEDDRARLWVEDAVELARATGVGWAAARAAYGRARLAENAEDAERHYDAGIAAGSASGRPFELARIQLAAGSFLRRQRKRMAARDHLRAAAVAFDVLGAEPWAERAREELRATGETVSKRVRRSVEHLTPQELHVARAVADGYSNADVAARLFLSRRTVEFHLRNVFAKLGISSRTQLAKLSLDDPTDLNRRLNGSRDGTSSARSR